MKSPLRWLYAQLSMALFIFALLMNACDSISTKENESRFQLSPPLKRVYPYSFRKISSSSHNSGNVTGDTVNIHFNLERVEAVDSLIRFRLTFNNMSWKRAPVRISFRGKEIPKNAFPSNPFAIIDSIGYFLKGKSMYIVLNNKGIVRKTEGFEEMLSNVAREANTTEGSFRMLADHLSEEALTDFFNLFFSFLPEAELNEDKKWVRDLTLITKAPVKVSTVNTLEQVSGDTAEITSESMISAYQGPGNPPYMKGNERGRGRVSYSSGLPFFYERQGETITTTNHYEVNRKENIIVQMTGK